MKKIDLCDAGLLQPFVGCLERRGLNAVRYLERQLIPPEMVAAGIGRITRRQVWRFFDDVVRHDGIETIGFLDDDPYAISYLGPIGSALRQAVTLRDAIETFSVMLPRITSGNLAWQEESGYQSWFCCRGEGLTAADYPTDHFTVMALAEIVKLAAGPEWRPTAIRLHSGHTRALDQAALVADVEAHLYRGMSAVRFPSALLSKPLQHLPDLDTGPQHQGGRTIDANFGPALTELLASYQRHGGIPSSSEVAEILGMHRSSLYRALKKESLSWRKVTDRVRYLAAVDLLQDPGASVKAIAFELGYSDPSNFNRAFRRLSGMSPTAYRRRSG